MEGLAAMTEEEFRNGTGAAQRGAEHGIAEAYRDVHEFHKVFDHPRNFIPTRQPEDRKTARADWIAEEVQELRDAFDILGQADAYLDIAYFAIGGLVEMGVNPGELWRIVHGANMAKVFPDGSVHRREDGKIIKPEGWTPPDEKLAAEVIRQLQRIEAPLFQNPSQLTDAINDVAENTNDPKVREDALRLAAEVESIGKVHSNMPNAVDIVSRMQERRAAECAEDWPDAPLPEPITDDGTADRLRQLHEEGRAGVRAAMGEKLLREPSKAPDRPANPHDGRFKPQGFA
jgi:predicted HAD superfamily Cof-like phosphohydrolase